MGKKGTFGHVSFFVYVAIDERASSSCIRSVSVCDIGEWDLDWEKERYHFALIFGLS
jgi:hypothetical protein